MINQQLFSPQSIIVVGASNDITKPGGKLLKNLIDAKYAGKLMVVNPTSDQVRGIPSWHSVEEVPEADMAVLAIRATLCVDAVGTLASKKGVKAFVVISAGFSEEGEEGKLLERKLVSIVEENNACMIGPNR